MNTLIARTGSALAPLAFIAIALVAVAAAVVTGDAFAASTDLTGLTEAGFRRP